MQMSAEERAAYDRHMDNIMVQNDILETKVLEGLERGIEQGMAKGIEQGMAKGIEQGMAKGIEQGMAKGIEQGKIDVALKMKALGMAIVDIAKVTGLTEEAINSL
jgi:predicted transposase/invertase (TIGR01784 family)